MPRFEVSHFGSICVNFKWTKVCDIVRFKQRKCIVLQTNVRKWLIWMQKFPT
uniref:Uncharacterized protein n=1 Tax=Tetranychus urticae TaxID=32264 RepID=T1K5P7_TETUR